MKRRIGLALNVLGLLVAGIASGASWDEVLSKYQECRTQLADTSHTLNVLTKEIERLGEQTHLHSGKEREGFDQFLRYLSETRNYCENDLNRTPGLLTEIEKEIKKYEGTTTTCPECIESSTFLLCITVEELNKDLDRSIRSAKDFSECLGNEQALHALLRAQRGKLEDMETSLRGTEQEQDVGPELSQVRELMDKAESSLRQEHTTWTLTYAFQARSKLEWLEGVLSLEE